MWNFLIIFPFSSPILDPAAVHVIVTIELAHEATADRRHRSAQTAVPNSVVAQRVLDMSRVYRNRLVAVIRAARAHAQSHAVHVQSHAVKAVIHAMETIKRLIHSTCFNLTRFLTNFFFAFSLCLKDNFEKNYFYSIFCLLDKQKRVLSINQVNQSMK